MILAMLGFAFEDMFIKQLTNGLPTGQILIVLGGGGAIVFSIWAKFKGERLFTSALLNKSVILRNAGEVFGTIGFITALSLIPISTASAVLQATPLCVTLAAALIFKESVGWRRWTAIFVGLFGVLLIIRPGFEGFDPNALFVIMAVIGLSVRDLATRSTPKTITSLQLATYAFAMSVPTGFFLLAVAGDSFVQPNATDSWRMIAAVFVGCLSYYAIVAAMRVGDISVVTPFRYTRLVFALIIGVVAFSERPDALTLIGAGIVVAAGIFTLWREARLRRTSPSSTPAL